MSSYKYIPVLDLAVEDKGMKEAFSKPRSGSPNGKGTSLNFMREEHSLTHCDRLNILIQGGTKQVFTLKR